MAQCGAIWEKKWEKDMGIWGKKWEKDGAKWRHIVPIGDFMTNGFPQYNYFKIIFILMRG